MKELPKWFTDLEEVATNDKAFSKRGCSDGNLVFHGYHNAILKVIAMVRNEQR